MRQTSLELRTLSTLSIKKTDISFQSLMQESALNLQRKVLNGMLKEIRQEHSSNLLRTQVVSIMETSLEKSGLDILLLLILSALQVKPCGIKD